MALGRNGHSEKKTEQETTFWSVCRPKKSLKLGILCMENLAEFKSSLWCSVSFSFKKKKKRFAISFEKKENVYWCRGRRSWYTFLCMLPVIAAVFLFHQRENVLRAQSDSKANPKLPTKPGLHSSIAISHQRSITQAEIHSQSSRAANLPSWMQP